MIAVNDKSRVWLSWVKRWFFEFALLSVVCFFIGLEHGFVVGLHVMVALIIVAVGADAISGVLGLLFGGPRPNIRQLSIKVVVLFLYYTFLVLGELIGIVYITVAPSIIFGGLLYYFKR